MEENVVSKIKDLDSDTLDDYVEEYEGNACTGKYHLGDNLLPYHFSDAIFLHDNAYHYPCYNKGKKIKTKIHNAINNDNVVILAFVLGCTLTLLATMCSYASIDKYFITLDEPWVGIPSYLVLFFFFIALFFKLCSLISKEAGLLSLTVCDIRKTHRLKNVPMVHLDKNMPWKITTIHSRFSSTMEDILKYTPQALSNAGWDLLISSYEDYTSLYVFLVEKNGVISDELMDSYATKLEKRYKKFSLLAQDVIDTAQRTQLFLNKEESNAAKLQQYMIDSDALRAIPLEEEKEL